MLSSQVFLSSVAIAIAGAISLVALLIARLTSLLGKKPTGKYQYYECGFHSNNRTCVYLGGRGKLVSLYVVFEALIAWLLMCCSFDVAQNSWHGDIFVRVVLVITAVLMGLVYRSTASSDPGTSIFLHSQ
jgi:NADH:ubiquinone oxidoreductase subunit 3 (subunit A)